MATMTNTAFGASVAALDQAIKDDFSSVFEQSVETLSEVTRVVTTTQKTVNLPFLSPTSGMKEWVSNKVLGNIVLNNQVLSVKDWEDTIVIDRNVILDDELGLYAGSGAMLARSARLLRERQMAALLENGTSATLAVNYDGLATFATNHPLENGTTQSNYFTTTALNATNYATVEAAFINMKGPDGLPFGNMPTHIIVPPALKATAELLFTTQLGGAGTSGGSNTLYNRVKIIVCPYLTSAVKWYLVNSAIQPLVWVDRTAPHIESLVDPTDANVFFQKKFIWSAEARGVAGYGPYVGILLASA